MNDEDQAELDLLRVVMAKMNRLRSNVIATQNASWSNMMYTFVAILGEAGYELEGATDAQCEEHLACYGGAGKTPHLLDHTPAPESLTEWLRERRIEADDHPTSGSARIYAERWRQENEEGWTVEHDDEHDRFQLAQAALAYTQAARLVPQVNVAEAWFADEVGWPWNHDWWKPSADPIPNLVKAGALIAAEIDRLLRARETVGA